MKSNLICRALRSCPCYRAALGMAAPGRKDAIDNQPGTVPYHRGCMKTRGFARIQDEVLEVGMSRFVEGCDRRQIALLPDCLDDYVTEDTRPSD